MKMTITSRACLAAALCVLAGQGAFATGAAREPSLDEMIEALAVKPGEAPREGMLMRGLRPGQAARAATGPAREGKLQLAVQFEYASATISPASRELLQRLAAAMKSPALAGLEYRVEGHTDSSGDGTANLRLSERRARAVLEYLASASGVDISRMAALGMGSAKPIDSDDPRAAANRRVVVVSMKPASATAAATPGPGGTDPGAAAPASASRPGPQATAAAREGAGTVEQVKGELQVRRGRSNSVLQSGSRVREGDVLTTGENASALLRLDDGAKLLLRAGSVIRVATLRLAGDPSKWSQAFDLVVGAFRYVTGALGGNRPDAVVFSTATATVGIRGTDLDVVYAPQAAGGEDPGTYVKVNKGAVALGGVDGTTVALAKDEQAYAGPMRPATRGARPEPAAMRLKERASVFKSGEMDELLEDR